MGAPILSGLVGKTDLIGKGCSAMAFGLALVCAVPVCTWGVIKTARAWRATPATLKSGAS